MKNIYTINAFDKGYFVSIGRKAPWDNFQVRVPKFVAKFIAKYLVEQGK